MSLKLSRVVYLYQESVVPRVLSMIPLLGRYALNDHSRKLNRSPVSLLYYNLRAVSIALGLLFICLLWMLTLVLPSTVKMLWTVRLMSVFWVAEVSVTLILHERFVRRLNAWSVAASRTSELPPGLESYFVLDTVLILFLIILGKLWSLGLDAFAFLLFAYIVVYSTYGRGIVTVRNRIYTIVFFQLIVTVLLFSAARITIEEPHWFYVVLNTGPLLYMSVVTVLSVLLVSWLRRMESEIAQKRLVLLGRYEQILTNDSVKSSFKGTSIDDDIYSERQLRKKITNVIKDLCSLGPPFWYDSACLWFVESHQDRGEVLLPGPNFNFEEADQYKHGIDNLTGLFRMDTLLLFHSIEDATESDHQYLLNLKQSSNRPAAFIPLFMHERLRGILALYGKENGPPLVNQETAFLSALGSILSSAIEQWEGRHRDRLYKEMNELFTSLSLNEVFAKAASILKKYLGAAGCLVIFRRDPETAVMEVVAGDGFRTPNLKGFYSVGEGQTGICAAQGQTIRYDSVTNHLDHFGSDRLNDLEEAHGRKIESWLNIPIGPKEQNYGVLKFVNSTYPCNWFTDRVQELGEEVALRLHVIIEKFIYFQRVEEAMELAQHAARRAEVAAQATKVALEKTEHIARQRQEDLMVITHQLQGPLISINGAITAMQRKSSPGSTQYVYLDHMHALVEDALTICYGTFATFGLEMGRGTSFEAHDINAPVELKKLSERLQKTNARIDLRFVYREAPGFPTLRMDRGVFTSVFYSLIHNAMKYAKGSSEVTLECGFEDGNPVLKLKSVGEPIKISERDLIFEKYGRGSIVSKTGRSHSGVGLGLWIARKLMRAIGGDLTLELRAEYPEMSIFVVHVPVNDSKDA
jgi:signal transduction histidine kinase